MARSAGPAAALAALLLAAPALAQDVCVELDSAGAQVTDGDNLPNLAVDMTPIDCDTVTIP